MKFLMPSEITALLLPLTTSHRWRTYKNILVGCLKMALTYAWSTHAQRVRIQA